MMPPSYLVSIVSLSIIQYIYYIYYTYLLPGVVARSEACSLGMQAAILPPPLIQEEQLSVAGERMCTKYG